MISSKICTTCNESKLLEHFSLDKRASDGRQSRCKKCCNEINRLKRAADPEFFNLKRREYYESNKERILETNSRSRKRNDEKVKQCKKEYYEKVKNTNDYKEKIKKYQVENKDKKREYDVDYRLKNKERCLDNSREWALRNKEKRRASLQNYKAKRKWQESSGVSAKEMSEWISSQKKVCFWCEVDCFDNYQIDHFYPLSKGGAHVLSNMVISCPSCNYRKNCKDPIEFADKNGVCELKIDSFFKTRSIHTMVTKSA